MLGSILGSPILGNDHMEHETDSGDGDTDGFGLRVGSLVVPRG